jgi:hypothetical protein
MVASESVETPAWTSDIIKNLTPGPLHSGAAFLHHDSGPRHAALYGPGARSV